MRRGNARKRVGITTDTNYTLCVIELKSRCMTKRQITRYRRSVIGVGDLETYSITFSLFIHHTGTISSERPRVDMADLPHIG